jgi:hypothetical protein
LWRRRRRLFLFLFLLLALLGVRLGQAQQPKRSAQQRGEDAAAGGETGQGPRQDIEAISVHAVGLLSDDKAYRQ